MTVQSAAESTKLSFSYKFYWGLASLGTSLISGIYGGLLTIFYQDYLGLSARWIGIAATIYAIWNALNDPLFGYITDNTRSRKGRRIQPPGRYRCFPEKNGNHPSEKGPCTSRHSYLQDQRTLPFRRFFIQVKRRN